MKNSSPILMTPKFGFLTFKSLASFPAKAKSKVVFPEPGGPKSNVILQKVYHQNKINLGGESKTRKKAKKNTKHK